MLRNVIIGSILLLFICFIVSGVLVKKHKIEGVIDQIDLRDNKSTIWIKSNQYLILDLDTKEAQLFCPGDEVIIENYSFFNYKYSKLLLRTTYFNNKLHSY